MQKEHTERYVLQFVDGPLEGQIMIRPDIPVRFGAYFRKEIVVHQGAHWGLYFFEEGVNKITPDEI